MRSQRAEDDTTRVSLFPFLAVLLCTMGALIVLLIVIARQARVAAAQPDPTDLIAVKLPDEQRPDKQRRAALMQQAAQLEARRREVSEQLSGKQKQLGFIEDRSRKLEAELVKLQAQYEKAVQLSQADTHQRAQAAADLLRLKAAVAEAKKTLKSLEKDAGAKRPSYSIIPYQGSRKTKRRPIYIECRADKVILHPEGIVLTEEDFLVPSDTSNPLASALRATREYLAEQTYSTGEEDPYPLILVRPGGTDAYTAVRRAMKGWGPEFGYELIDDDWEMEYPPADPNLAQTQYRAIQEARARQQALIAKIRSKMQRRSYVPTPGRGGLIEEGSGGGLGGGRHRFGQMGTAGSHAGGAGRETQPPGDRSPRQGSRPGTGSPRPGGSEQLASSGHLGNRGSGNRNSGNQGSGNRGSGERNSGNRESGHGNHNNGNHSNTDPKDRKRGVSNKPGGKPGGRGATSPGGRAQTAGNGGPSAQRGASGGGAQTGGSGGGPGGESGASPSSLSGGSPTGSQSLAGKRGKNWGIKRNVRSSIGITRPVRVSLYNDRLVVRSDETSRRGKVITLGPDARADIDAFVAAAWQQAESWGIAGKGMYWKPILSFQVEPGGERRFQELSALLKDSGLEVRRAKPGSQAFRNRPLRKS